MQNTMLDFSYIGMNREVNLQKQNLVECRVDYDNTQLKVKVKNISQPSQHMI